MPMKIVSVRPLCNRKEKRRQEKTPLGILKSFKTNKSQDWTRLYSRVKVVVDSFVHVQQEKARVAGESHRAVKPKIVRQKFYPRLLTIFEEEEPQKFEIKLKPRKNHRRRSLTIQTYSLVYEKEWRRVAQRWLNDHELFDMKITPISHVTMEKEHLIPQGDGDEPLQRAKSISCLPSLVTTDYVLDQDLRRTASSTAIPMDQAPIRLEQQLNPEAQEFVPYNMDNITKQFTDKVRAIFKASPLDYIVKGSRWLAYLTSLVTSCAALVQDLDTFGKAASIANIVTTVTAMALEAVDHFRDSKKKEAMSEVIGDTVSRMVPSIIAGNPEALIPQADKDPGKKLPIYKIVKKCIAMVCLLAGFAITKGDIDQMRYWVTSNSFKKAILENVTELENTADWVITELIGLDWLEENEAITLLKGYIDQIDTHLLNQPMHYGQHIEEFTAMQKLYKGVSAVLGNMKNTPNHTVKNLVIALNTKSSLLYKHIQETYGVIEACATRPEPVPILIMGEPGCGKTSFVNNYLIPKLAKTLGLKPGAYAQRFTGVDKFWMEYGGQAFYIFEEAFAMAKEKEDPLLTAINSVCSKGFFNQEGAYIKYQPCNARFVFIISNIQTCPDFSKHLSAQASRAFWDRLEGAIEMSVHPAYKSQTGLRGSHKWQPDWSHVSLSRVNWTLQSASGKWTRNQNSPPVTIDQLVRELTDKYNASIRTYNEDLRQRESLMAQNSTGIYTAHIYGRSGVGKTYFVNGVAEKIGQYMNLPVIELKQPESDLKRGVYTIHDKVPTVANQTMEEKYREIHECIPPGSILLMTSNICPNRKNLMTKVWGHTTKLPYTTEGLARRIGIRGSVTTPVESVFVPPHEAYGAEMTARGIVENKTIASFTKFIWNEYTKFMTATLKSEVIYGPPPEVRYHVQGRFESKESLLHSLSTIQGAVNLLKGDGPNKIHYTDDMPYISPRSFLLPRRLDLEASELHIISLMMSELRAHAAHMDSKIAVGSVTYACVGSNVYVSERPEVTFEILNDAIKIGDRGLEETVPMSEVIKGLKYGFQSARVDPLWYDIILDHKYEILQNPASAAAQGAIRQEEIRFAIANKAVQEKEKIVTQLHVHQAMPYIMIIGGATILGLIALTIYALYSRKDVTELEKDEHGLPKLREEKEQLVAQSTDWDKKADEFHRRAMEKKLTKVEATALMNMRKAFDRPWNVPIGDSEITMVKETLKMQGGGEITWFAAPEQVVPMAKEFLKDFHPDDQHAYGFTTELGYLDEDHLLNGDPEKVGREVAKIDSASKRVIWLAEFIQLPEGVMTPYVDGSLPLPVNHKTYCGFAVVRVNNHQKMVKVMATVSGAHMNTLRVHDGHNQPRMYFMRSVMALLDEMTYGKVIPQAINNLPSIPLEIPTAFRLAENAFCILKGTGYMFALRICGRFVLGPHHALHPDMSVTCDVGNGTGTFPCKLYSALPSRDLAIYEIESKSYPQARDITNHFVTEELSTPATAGILLQKNTGGNTMYSSCEMYPLNKPLPRDSEQHITQGGYYADFVKIGTSLPIRNGSCGAPYLVLQNNEYKIHSIHVAQHTPYDYGVAALTTQPIIKLLMSEKLIPQSVEVPSVKFLCSSRILTTNIPTIVRDFNIPIECIRAPELTGDIIPQIKNLPEMKEVVQPIFYVTNFLTSPHVPGLNHLPPHEIGEAFKPLERPDASLYTLIMGRVPGTPGFIIQKTRYDGLYKGHWVGDVSEKFANYRGRPVEISDERHPDRRAVEAVIKMIRSGSPTITEIDNLPQVLHLTRGETVIMMEAHPDIFKLCDFTRPGTALKVDTTLGLLGTMPYSRPGPKKHKFSRTPFSNLFDPKMNDVAPSVLRPSPTYDLGLDGLGRSSIIATQIYKFEGEFDQLDETARRWACHQVLGLFKQHFTPKKVAMTQRPWSVGTMADGLNGSQQLNLRAFGESLNLSTTAGGFWRERYSIMSKRDFFHQDEKGFIKFKDTPAANALCEQVNVMMMTLSEGVRPLSISEDKLKTELLPLKKVTEGQTRLFSVADLAEIICMRRIFADLFPILKLCHLDTPIQTGVNHLLDYSPLKERLKATGSTGFAGDFKRFDKTIHPTVIKDVISCICKAMGTRFCDMAIPLGQMIAEGIHWVENTLYIRFRGQNSGGALTSTVNSFADFYLICYSLAIKLMRDGIFTKDRTYLEFIDCIVHGDDSLVAVKDGFDFSIPDVRDALAPLGMTYGPGEVDTLQNIDLGELWFLSRKFYSPNNGYYVWPALKESSIIRHLFWTSDNSDSQLADNVNIMLEEAALHDFAFFMKVYAYVNVIINCIRRASFLRHLDLRPYSLRRASMTLAMTNTTVMGQEPLCLRGDFMLRTSGEELYEYIRHRYNLDEQATEVISFSKPRFVTDELSYLQTNHEKFASAINTYNTQVNDTLDQGIFLPAPMEIALNTFTNVQTSATPQSGRGGKRPAPSPNKSTAVGASMGATDAVIGSSLNAAVGSAPSTGGTAVAAIPGQSAVTQDASTVLSPILGNINYPPAMLTFGGNMSNIFNSAFANYQDVNEVTIASNIAVGTEVTSIPYGVDNLNPVAKALVQMHDRFGGSIDYRLHATGSQALTGECLVGWVPDISRDYTNAEIMSYGMWNCMSLSTIANTDISMQDARKFGFFRSVDGSGDTDPLPGFKIMVYTPLTNPFGADGATITLHILNKLGADFQMAGISSIFQTPEPPTNLSSTLQTLEGVSLEALMGNIVSVYIDGSSVNTGVRQCPSSAECSVVECHFMGDSESTRTATNITSVWWAQEGTHILRTPLYVSSASTNPIRPLDGYSQEGYWSFDFSTHRPSDDDPKRIASYSVPHGDRYNKYVELSEFDWYPGGFYQDGQRIWAKFNKPLNKVSSGSYARWGVIEGSGDKTQSAVVSLFSSEWEQPDIFIDDTLVAGFSNVVPRADAPYVVPMKIISVGTDMIHPRMDGDLCQLTVSDQPIIQAASPDTLAGSYAPTIPPTYKSASFLNILDAIGHGLPVDFELQSPLISTPIFYCRYIPDHGVVVSGCRQKEFSMYTGVAKSLVLRNVRPSNTTAYLPPSNPISLASRVPSAINKMKVEAFTFAPSSARPQSAAAIITMAAIGGGATGAANTSSGMFGAKKQREHETEMQQAAFQQQQYMYGMYTDYDSQKYHDQFKQQRRMWELNVAGNAELARQQYHLNSLLMQQKYGYGTSTNRTAYAQTSAYEQTGSFGNWSSDGNDFEEDIYASPDVNEAVNADSVAATRDPNEFAAPEVPTSNPGPLPSVEPANSMDNNPADDESELTLDDMSTFTSSTNSTARSSGSSSASSANSLAPKTPTAQATKGVSNEATLAEGSATADLALLAL